MFVLFRMWSRHVAPLLKQATRYLWPVSSMTSLVVKFKEFAFFLDCHEKNWKIEFLLQTTFPRSNLIKIEK